MTNNFFPVEAGGGNALSTDLAESLLTVGSMGGGEVSYLKFTKAGAWEYGREGDTLDDEVLA
ncbi:MAG: hypothetical protein GY703_11605, partial [Gammaproteobacteria bacterium]|nr:hypothetical protein [Gammaproteobacteria bacterium]